MVLRAVLLLSCLSSSVFASEGSWRQIRDDKSIMAVFDARLYRKCQPCLKSAEYSRCPECVNFHKYPEEKDTTKEGSPCSCPLADDDVPRNLGGRHYPQFVPEIKCDSTTCRPCASPYKCQAILYPINVLVKRKVGEHPEMKLPSTLREEWKFREFQISVGCKCAI